MKTRFIPLLTALALPMQGIGKNAQPGEEIRWCNLRIQELK